MIRIILFYCFYLFCFILFSQSYAQDPNLRIAACNTTPVSNLDCSSPQIVIYQLGSSTPSYAPPTSNMILSKLQITYSVELYKVDYSFFTYNASNWGVQIIGTNGNDLKYYVGGSSGDGVTVEVDDSNIIQTSNIFSGTVVVTLNFPTNYLTSDISNLISSNAIIMQPYYFDTTNANLKFYWKSDEGALRYAPSIQVESQDSAFVVKISKPSDLSGVKVDTTTTPNTLAATAVPNKISGYILAYWLDSDSNGQALGCRANSSGWQFYSNPVATNNASQSTPLSCTYTNYNSSFIGGGTSKALGCPANASILSYSSALGSGTPSSDDVAIPALLQNPTAFPSDGIGTQVGCYYVVYIPSTQKTWVKSGVRNGEVYGVTVWALNSIYDDSISDLRPNYSLAHSAISYVSSVDIPLASTSKTPDLPTSTTDCFVVTAASGDENSKSVFYWRALRDEYLTSLGITFIYHQHAGKWSHWLQKHPELKPYFNFILKNTGRIFYHTNLFAKKVKRQFLKSVKIIQNAFVQEASALEFTDPDIVQNEEIDQFESRDSEQKQPNYEIAFLGGVLFPSEDKALYDKYYPSQMSPHFSLYLGSFIWFQSFGLTYGFMGRYTTNSYDGTVQSKVGTTQAYTRTFYAAAAMGAVGVRFRSVRWPYLQPHIYGSIGASRLREESTVGDVASSEDGSDPSIGVTYWSPVYEVGGNMDVSLSTIAGLGQGELGVFLSDVLLRFGVSYSSNPSKALSTSGLFVTVGFVFLLL